MKTTVFLARTFCLCLIFWLSSCSSEVEPYFFTSKVKVLLANQSDKPYRMWVGHNPLAPRLLIQPGAHMDTVLTLKIAVYDVTDYNDDNTTYQEDRLDYKLQINVAEQNDSITKTVDVAIHELYFKGYRLKFYWNGRNLTYDYAL